ncbi:hypothetical protein J4P02_22385 [Pseudomonas sp. NFXW11]|uniref:hypothetical protein n=1 Tax=Pseudomonas sp. NFXW11 TaxID=2819531 RepID=UPI003CE69984
MQGSQNYLVTIQDLFTVSSKAIFGAQTVVAIMDGDTEVDRLIFNGRVGPGSGGYNRRYIGKPGLRAEKAFGPGTIVMALTMN